MKNFTSCLAVAALASAIASTVFAAPAIDTPQQPLTRDAFLKAAGARFDAFDTNRDGKLDRAELIAARDGKVARAQPVKFQMPEEFKHVDWSRD